MVGRSGFLAMFLLFACEEADPGIRIVVEESDLPPDPSGVDVALPYPSPTAEENDEQLNWRDRQLSGALLDLSERSHLVVIGIPTVLGSIERDFPAPGHTRILRVLSISVERVLRGSSPSTIEVIEPPNRVDLAGRRGLFFIGEEGGTLFARSSSQVMGNELPRFAMTVAQMEAYLHAH